MKAVKLNLVLFLLAITAAMSFAETRMSQAVIRQLEGDKVSVMAEICHTDQMRVEITNEDGDIVYSDKLNGAGGITSKTYDFSKTRVGEYFITVYCNERVLETVVISDGEVAIRDNYHFALY